jgi:Fe-S cluster biogenesis protein NfuA
MTIQQDVSVDLEFTPNPNTLKYVTNVNFLQVGAQNFPKPETAAGKAPLAEELFKIGGIAGVMIGKNFVTVTLSDQDSLTELNDKIIDTVKNFALSGRSAVNPEALKEAHSAVSSGSASEIEQKIIKILDEEIRPAVAMDGGDITFEKYEDGLVFLHMKGSCSGCPSSTATLKLGIENRLRDAVPEIVEVIPV